ncbi:SRPBCC family protein [Gordonia sinesedis]
MKVITHQGDVDAPCDRAFAYVADYRTVPRWFFAVRRFDPLSEQTEGVGATFAAEMTIGPKTMKSTVQITEWVENERIRLESIDGMVTDSTWSFRDNGHGGTVLDVRFGYALPGGLAGRALAAIVEPVVGQAVRHTESTLREQVLASRSLG